MQIIRHCGTQLPARSWISIIGRQGWGCKEENFICSGSRSYLKALKTPIILAAVSNIDSVAKVPIVDFGSAVKMRQTSAFQSSVRRITSSSDITRFFIEVATEYEDVKCDNKLRLLQSDEELTRFEGSRRHTHLSLSMMKARLCGISLPDRCTSKPDQGSSEDQVIRQCIFSNGLSQGIHSDLC